MVDASRRRARARRNLAAAGALAVAGTGVGFLVAAETAGGHTGYVTAVATDSSVTQSLDLTGTVAPSDQATADFQVGGTVSAVDVGTGQAVTAGQTLATLDATTLQGDLSTAQSRLSAAEAKLTEDELNQATAVGSGSPGGSGTGGSQAQSASAVLGSGGQVVLTSATPTSPTGRVTAAGPGNASISTEQQAVVAGQQAVDTDMQTVNLDLATVSSACAAGSSSTTTTSGTTTSGTTTSGTTTPTAGGTGSGGTPACSAALDTTQHAEEQVAADQKTLAAAESALAQSLSGGSSPGVSTSPQSPSTGAPGATAASGATGRGTSGNSGSAPSQSQAGAITDTPQQLALDQAAIDSAEATVVEAQHSLAAATLAAPISGTVVSIGVAAGQAVTPGASGAAITIVGSGDYQAQTTLDTEQAMEASAGDHALVTVDGMTATFEGTVTRVGPVQAAQGGYTYPLVIALASSPTRIPAGADARIQVELRSVSDTVVVPTSAVHTTATGESYVLDDRNGSQVRQKVTTGVVGAVHTQITSGLTVGVTVVLANPSAPLPASNTPTNGIGGGGNGPLAGIRAAIRAGTLGTALGGARVPVSGPGATAGAG